MLGVVVCVAAALGGGVLGTWSTYTGSATLTQGASTPPLRMIGLNTPKAADATNYTVSGIAPGGSSDSLLNLRNDGSTPTGLAETVTTSSSSSLDTGPNGLVIQVDDCSTIWQQSVVGGPASCNATDTVIFGPISLAASNGAPPSYGPATLPVLGPGGTDHLRVRFSLPAAAPASYSSLTSTPTVTLWGYQGPGAPTAVTATPGESSVAVSWTPPTQTGGSAITGYTATATPGGAACTTTTLSCSIPGLSDGTTYTITVTANNSTGPGLPSAPVTAIPYPASVMSPAQGLSLWLDGADVATTFTGSSCAGATSSGSAVACWTDKSSQHENFTQATTGDQPTVTTLNGHSALNFTSNSQVLQSINGNDTYQTVITAVQDSAIDTGDDSMLFGQAGSDFSIRLRQVTTPNNNDWNANTGSPPLVWTNGTRDASVPQGSTAVVTDVSTGPNTFPTSVSNTFLSRGIVGTVGEVLAFNSTLTDDQRQSVESYLAAKWGAPLASTPSSPAAVSAVPGVGTAAVSWMASSASGGSAISAYTVTASPGGATCSTSGALTCTLAGLTPQLPYTLAVAATNATGVGAPAVVRVVPLTPTPGANTPSAPTGLSLAPGDGQVVVAWGVPSSDGGSAITGYTATAQPGGITCTTTTLGCTLTGLSDGTEYGVSVTAANQNGNGSPAVATTIPYPASIMTGAGGLSLWLDGASLNSVTSSSTCTGGAAAVGTTVGCWSDQSGNTNNFTQPTAIDQPTTGTLDGLGSIRFASHASYLQSGVNGSYQTVFAVTRPATLGVYGYVFSTATNSDNNVLRLVTTGSADALDNNLNPYNGYDWDGGTGSPPLGWFDGAQAVPPTPGTDVLEAISPSVNTSSNATVSGTFYQRGFVGDIGEIVVFNTVLTTAQRQSIEQYLAAKWGFRLLAGP